MNLKNLVVLLPFYYLFILNTGVSGTRTSAGSPTISFLDVGQGDSILIKTGLNRNVLVDGGPSHDVDFHIFSRQQSNRCHLGAVVLTHPHKDHVAGLERIMRRCSADLVGYNYVSYESGVYEEWVERSVHLNTKNLYSGDTFSVDDMDFYVLWPPEGFIDSENVNNDSIVLLLDYNETEVLLTGDAESEVLSKIDIDFILSKTQGGFDIVKVPHQGARDGLNKDFMHYLKPKYAVISVGKNKYGHPDSEVVSYFNALGTRVLRTDESGTVVFRLDSF